MSARFNQKALKRRSQRGAALIEAALLIALVALMGFAGAKAVGVNVSSALTTAKQELGGATIITCDPFTPCP